MVMLIGKMLWDVWKNKVPFTAIFLMMFAGNFIFSGITGEYNGMEKSFHSYIEETNLANAWVTGDKFDSSQIDRLEIRLLLPRRNKDFSSLSPWLIIKKPNP